MELGQKYTTYFSLVAGKEITDADEDEINDVLEELMNKYEIFKITAVLNPFNKNIYINDKNNE